MPLVPNRLSKSTSSRLPDVLLAATCAVVAIVALLLVAPAARAAACVSSGSGNWSDPAKWAACGGGFPAVGDTVTISAGHTITIDGNRGFGTDPLGLGCELDIDGTLEWPSHPGGDWTFTATGRICINAGGLFTIGTVAAPLNQTHYADLMFDNNNFAYDLYISDPTGQFKAFGAPGYSNTAGTVQRARISSCAPACTIGVGRTITLDRDVNWVASAAAPAVLYALLVVGVGGSDTAPGLFDLPEAVSVWTSPAANQIGGVTLTSNHQPGDIVAITTRNVIIHSSSIDNLGKLYTDQINSTAGGAWTLSWARLDYMGQPAGLGAAAVTSDSGDFSDRFGTAEYVAITNLVDSGGNPAWCFSIRSGHWTKFEGNTCWYTGGGTGLYADMFSGALPSPVVQDFTYLDRAVGVGTAVDTESSYFVVTDALWTSGGEYGVVTRGDVTDSLIHWHGTAGISVLHEGADYAKSRAALIARNEVKNITAGEGLVLVSGVAPKGLSAVVRDNHFDSVSQSCVRINSNETSRTLEFFGNYYDDCNQANVATWSAIRYDAGNDWVYLQGESFGSRLANHKSNIMVMTPTATSGASTAAKLTCNECSFVAALARPAGWAPEIYLYQGELAYGNVTNLGQETYYTLQNVGGVNGVVEGWGPLGSYISRETVTIVDGTVRLKVVPGSALEYARIPIGTIYVTAGATVEVELKIRANQALAAGRRPRLSLRGCGALPSIDYAETAGLVNTWETVSVSKAATATGSMHVYVEVINDLNAPLTDILTPVWPPTLHVFADAVKIHK